MPFSTTFQLYRGDQFYIPGQEDSDDDGGYAGIDKNQC
jgi:hypothetical protein